MEVGEEDQILVAKEKRTKIQKLGMSRNYFSEPNCDVNMANCLILLAQMVIFTLHFYLPRKSNMFLKFLN